MNEIVRWESTPQEYLRESFVDTKADGSLPIMYYTSNWNRPEKLVHHVSWNRDDLEFLLNEYERLTSAFKKISALYEKHEKEEKFDELLTKDEYSIWETYIRPFDPFEMDEGEINILHFRAEQEDLDDEEHELLERHYEWKEEQSLKRLPHKRCSPSDLIEAARWYTYHVQYCNREESVYEFGKTLIRTLLMYHFSFK